MSVTREIDCIIKGLGDYHLYPSPIDPIFCTNREAMITLEGEEGKGGRG